MGMYAGFSPGASMAVGWLSQPLADDSAVMRKLKPGLIKARAIGKPHAEPADAPRNRRALVGHEFRSSPLPLIGAALAAGVAIAKLIDWRGHAHPRN
jgi:hypothetical protein